MQHSIGLVDYVVFGLSIVLSAITGIYHACKKQSTTTEYLVADGKMKAFPVALSYLVTFESTIFVLGFPAEVYIHGIMIWFRNLGLLLAVIISMQVVPKLFYPLGIKSIYEYFALRYNDRTIQRIGAIMIIIQSIMYGGTVIYGPGVALESVTNIPSWVTLLVLALTAIVYTSLGGIRAVIWTDVVQFFVILIGLAAVAIKGMTSAGGFFEVVSLNAKSGRLDVEFGVNPLIRHSIWALLVGGLIHNMDLFLGVAGNQRYRTTSTNKEVKKVLCISGSLFVIFDIFAVTVGLVAYAYFTSKGCDPLRSKQISNPNQIVPFMITDMFSNIQGLSGLFLAMLCSASLSTISSMLSVVSTVAIQDLIKPTFTSVSDKHLTYIAKAIVPVTAAAMMCVSVLLRNVKGSISQIATSIVFSFGAPCKGLFLVSMFFTLATTEGVAAASIIGWIFTAWLSIGHNFSTKKLVTPWLPLGPITNCSHQNLSLSDWETKLSGSITNVTDTVGSRGARGVHWLYSISYQYFSFMSVVVTVVFAFVFSLLSRKILSRYKYRETVDQRVVLSLRRTVFCCFSRDFWRKSFHSVGVDRTEDIPL